MVSFTRSDRSPVSPSLGAASRYFLIAGASSRSRRHAFHWESVIFIPLCAARIVFPVYLQSPPLSSQSWSTSIAFKCSAFAPVVFAKAFFNSGSADALASNESTILARFSLPPRRMKSAGSGGGATSGAPASTTVSVTCGVELPDWEPPHATRRNARKGPVARAFDVIISGRAHSTLRGP
ncbi:hypothetical protein OUZ56_032589 [Daphnia magna]|uniref:Uncharacterized protein n=1 Tax=Daphnia magna TaxID=35525 RepID=A0ABR0B9C5_9CRUS|nr:hypothetical protein OUZ56_032589 [Daphnia magna]